MNIEINDVVLEVEFMDVDFMEKFEPALEKMRNGISKIKTQRDVYVVVAYTQINHCVEDFFSAVWGEDVPNRLFNGSKNVMLHLDAISQIDKAYKAERQQFNNYSNKYLHHQNLRKQKYPSNKRP